jgi:predicted Zn-dependent peptidase
VANKHSYVESAGGLNFHFSDAGLWGVRISGASEHSTELLNAAVEQIRSLANGVEGAEVERAKAALKTKVFRALERQADSVEEGARNLKTFGSLMVFNDYAKLIDSVTGDQISSVTP